MQITTFDVEQRVRCEIEVALRRLASSPDSLEAARWNKILQLVEHLRSSGPEHELWGGVVLDKLALHKAEPLDPVREWQMKRFIDEWRAKNPEPSTWGSGFRREMLKRFPPKSQVHVALWVDWRDYSPIRDGLPEMHYRFQINRLGKTITEDARAKELVEAGRIIYEAFEL